MNGPALAISEQGRVAIAKGIASRVELYGGREDRPVNQVITQNLVTPNSVCFAPGNHLVITDIGDNSIKIYSLEGEPHLVSRITCHQHKEAIIIERTNQTSSSSSLSSSFCSDKILTPFYIVTGPSPLSQLFVAFEIHVLKLTMDWNTVELINYKQLSSPEDWFKANKKCEEKSIVHDHGDHHKVGGLNPLAVTGAQFCAMFYHVTERKEYSVNYKCLDGPMCCVGKVTPEQMNPRAKGFTVVVYVRLTDQTDRLIFHARYGNCYLGKRRNTIHVEYLMLMDEDFRQAVKRLSDQDGGQTNMYMNKQPCFKSTRHHGEEIGLKRKECAQDLVDFYNLHCLSHGITFAINICQLYKVDMHPSPSLEKDIQNGKQGMRRMIDAGIELKAMSEESWGRLANYADIELPEYQDSNRQKLDRHIDEFIQGLETE